MDDETHQPPSNLKKQQVLVTNRKLQQQWNIHKTEIVN